MSKLDYIIAQSNTEIVRAKIAEILADELSNQVTLIDAEGSPTDDQLLLKESIPSKIFDERFHRKTQGEGVYLNVILVSNPIGELTGNESQTDTVKYNIEYYSEAKDEGDDDGDKLASMKMQRCLMACRHILMSPHYIILDLPTGTVLSRVARNLQIIQPDNGVDTNYNINGMFTLEVKLTESQNRIEGVELQGNDTTHRLYDTDKGYYYSIDT
jgi:hypothetical protein